jgi:hypothetical protein
MNGMELFVGGVTMLFGFFAADIADRTAASHALAVQTAATTTAAAIYQDNADGTQTAYKGLKNGAAISAPMNGMRWGVGLAITGLPLFLSYFVKSGSGKTALHLFGFGAGVRILGKGLVDLSAFAMKKTAFGQRIYPVELQAMRAASPTGSVATALPGGTPSVGLAGVNEQRQLAGAPCAPCAQKAAMAAAAPPPPPPPPQGRLGSAPPSAPTPTYSPRFVLNPAWQNRAA